MDKNNNLIKAFTDLAPRYESVVDQELKKFWGWSYDRFVEKLLETTPINKNDDILDIATGKAIIPRKISRNKEFKGKIVGLDITWGMLQNCQGLIGQTEGEAKISLICANAEILPLSPSSFNIIFCGLAPHHMDTTKLVGESWRVLKAGGTLTIADVSGSRYWRIPGVRILLKIFTFLFFLITENISRASTEAAAASNVLTPNEWASLLAEFGYTNISIIKLPKSRALIPSPILIRANKHDRSA